MGFWTFVGRFGLLGGFMDFCGADWTFGGVFGLLRGVMDFWLFGRGKFGFEKCFGALNALFIHTFFLRTI